MTDSTYIAAATVLALTAGGGLGFWLGRRVAGRELTQRLGRAEKDLQAQLARAAETMRALQAKATRELQDARAAWQAGQAEAGAAQRAELDKLTYHLADACDELDRLRMIAARTPSPPDTDQGFAETIPFAEM